MDNDDGAPTRRRVLTAVGLGGLGGLAAAALPEPAHAGHDGTNVFHLSEGNIAPFTTELTTTQNDSASLRVRNLGVAPGVAFAIHAQSSGATTLISENAAPNGTALVGVSEANLNDGEFGGGSGTGVLGKSSSGVGVDGVSDTGEGVIGHSTSGRGASFGSMSNDGVFSGSQTGAGGRFTSVDGPGLVGNSQNGDGVRGGSSVGTAVGGHSNSGYGGQFSTDTGIALNVGGQAVFRANLDQFGLDLANDGTGGAAGGLSVFSRGGNPAVQGSTQGAATAVRGQSNDGIGGEFSSVNGPALVANGRAFVQANLDAFVLAVGNDHGGGDAGGVYGRSSGGSPGLRGDAAGPAFGLGVLGVCNEAGGAPAVGVQGVSGYGPGAVGSGPGTGVEGLSGTGTGVRGASSGGIGGHFTSAGGTALLVEGPAAFSSSGAATMPAGANQVFIAHPAVTAASHVSVTFVSDPGDRSVRWVQRNPGSGFTVHTQAGAGRKANLQSANLTYLVVEPIP